MRIKDYLILAAMAVLGLFGLVMVLGTIMDIGADENPGQTLALAFGLGVLPLGVSIWLTRSVLRGASRRKRESLERQVLDLAAGFGGRLTPPQVAQATHLTLEESKKFLDQLGLHGHCRMQLDDDGVVSYRFSV